MSSVRRALERGILPLQVVLKMMMPSTMLLSSVVSLLSTRALGCSTIKAVCVADEGGGEGQYPFIIIIMFLFCVDYWEKEKFAGTKVLKSKGLNSMGKRRRRFFTPVQVLHMGTGNISNN